MITGQFHLFILSFFSETFKNTEYFSMTFI